MGSVPKDSMIADAQAPDHAPVQDHVMTDAPVRDDGTLSKTASPDPKKHRIDPTIVKKQGKHLTEEEKDQIRSYHRARWGHKKARKNHKKGHRRCRDEQDCGHGECCIERREGQKYRIPGGTKPEGKHCIDTCVCK